MDKQELIEKVAKEISDKCTYTGLAPSWYMRQAIVVVDMFWPMVEAADSVYPLVKGAALDREATRFDINNFVKLETALFNLKGEPK